MTPTAPRSTSTAWSGTASTRPAAPPAAARVGGGGDADELHPRPAQEHGQGAGGVEMDPHLTTTPSVTPYSPRYPTFAALARRAVPAQQFARDAHWTDGGPRGLRRDHPVSCSEPGQTSPDVALFAALLN